MNAATRAIDAAINATARRLHEQSTADQLAAEASLDNEQAELEAFGRIASAAAAARLQLQRRVEELEPWLRIRLTRGMAVPPARPDLGSVLSRLGREVFPLEGGEVA